MNQIVLVGSLAYDRILSFSGSFSEHFLPEKLHQLSVGFLIDTVKQEFGGTAGNISYSLSLLGHSSDIVATLGSDRAPYIAHLEKNRIGTETISTAEELLTAGAYIISDSKNNQITPFAPGAGGIPYTRELDLSSRKVVLVSPTNKEDMLLFVEKAHGVGVTCFFDPGQQIPALSKEELQRAISFSTALFVNDYELALVLEKTGLTEQDILDQVDFLIVTLGSEGVRIATKENDTRIPAVSAVAVDPTGAGDAFRAGFVVGHVSGLSLELSSKVGATVAAYAVEAHGGQNHLPSTEDLSGRFTASYGEAWPL